MRFGRRQFGAQLVGETRDDLVLHFEKIRQRLVEAFRPDMLAAFGVNKLDIDAYALGVALDRALKQIAHPKLFADFPRVDVLAFKREGGVARDREGAANGIPLDFVRPENALNMPEGGFRREVQPRRQHWFLNRKSGSHSEPPPSARFPWDKDGSARRNIEPVQ